MANIDESQIKLYFSSEKNHVKQDEKPSLDEHFFNSLTDQKDGDRYHIDGYINIDFKDLKISSVILKNITCKGVTLKNFNDISLIIDNLECDSFAILDTKEVKEIMFLNKFVSHEHLTIADTKINEIHFKLIAFKQ